MSTVGWLKLMEAVCGKTFCHVGVACSLLAMGHNQVTNDSFCPDLKQLIKMHYNYNWRK